MTTPPASTTWTDASEHRRVGFIGLGDQGEPIAARILQAGIALGVWARRPSSVEDLARQGASVFTSPAELGDNCDLVGLCVTGDDDVRDVVYGGGLLDAMARGSVLVVHSTIAPQTCVDIAADARRLGVAVLDAPVSGGRAGATRGALSVMVGGDPDVVAHARPVMETYAESIRHVGSVGAGQAAKIINNGLFVANVAMAHLALELGQRFGLEADAFTDVLSTSSGSSIGLQALARLTTTDWGEHAWTVLGKDVALLVSMTSDDGSGEDRGHRLVDVAGDAIEQFTQA